MLTINMPAIRANAQRGIAAVELALTIPMIALIAAYLMLFVSALHNYQVAKKATHDAARYLSSASAVEMANAGMVDAHLDVARAIIAAEMGSLINQGPNPHTVTILCGTVMCNGNVTPSAIVVTIEVPVVDVLFPLLTAAATGGQRFQMTAVTYMPFIGR